MKTQPTVPPGATLPEVATRADVPVGLGVAKTRLGLHKTQFVELKDKWKGRVARSCLGKLHLAAQDARGVQGT